MLSPLVTSRTGMRRWDLQGENGYLATGCYDIKDDVVNARGFGLPVTKS